VVQATAEQRQAEQGCELIFATGVVKFCPPQIVCFWKAREIRLSRAFVRLFTDFSFG
jgi:hypothetical protein